MRYVLIDLTSDNYLQQPNLFGGYAGEHNETILQVKLPQRMIDIECSGYRFDFQTSEDNKISSPLIPITELHDGLLSYSLSEQLTIAGKLLFNVVAILSDKDSVKLISKTNSVILHIENSPDGNSILPDPSGNKDELLKMIDGRLSEIGSVGQKTPEGGEIFNDYENNKATAVNSHASGKGTQATAEAQTAIGKYNKTDSNSLFIVGDGTSDTKRSNAFNVTKNGSIIINDGEATGIGSIAGGTTDNELVSSLVGDALSGFVELTPAKASGHLSVAYGASSEAVVPGSATIGVMNTVGVKGYYWDTITFNTTNKQLTVKLSTTRRTSTRSNPEYPDSIDWGVNDIVCIKNGIWYNGYFVITAVSKTEATITLKLAENIENLPFTNISYKALAILGSYSYDAVDDRTIYAIQPVDTTQLLNKGKAPYQIRNGVVNLGFGAVSLGSKNLSTGMLSSSKGMSNLVSGGYSSVSGTNNRVYGETSNASGQNNSIYGSNSSVNSGNNNIVLGDNASAEGVNNKALDYAAHVEGFETEAKLQGHAEGNGTKAYGNISHAEGYQTEATGTASHAGGTGTIASANSQTALGKYNAIDDDALFIVGNGTSDTDRKNALVVKTDGSVMTNGKEIATINNLSNYVLTSLAVGKKIYNGGEIFNRYTDVEYNGTITKANRASGSDSHAEGYSTSATGASSHTEGSETQATANCAHAEGYKTKATGISSHAGGTGTIASGSNQMAIGKYNSEDSGAYFIVGNGTNDSNRSNAFVVSRDGTVRIAKEPIDIMDVANKGYVDNSLAKLAADIPTDDHINNLIDEKLGVIENGSY